MINTHIVIPLQKKKQSPCQETRSMVKLNRKSWCRKWKYRRCTECSIITHTYCSLFPFRCACVCACVRACVRAWIRSYPVNFRPGDVSWKRNMQMLMRFPLGGFTDGTLTKIPLNGPIGYYGQRYLNGIWMVFEWYFGFFVPFSDIEWYFKLPLRVPLSPAEMLLNGSMVLNDTEWYSMVISGWLFFVRRWVARYQSRRNEVYR